MSGFSKRVQELSTLLSRTHGNAALAVLTLENVGHVSGSRGLAASSAALAEYHRRLNDFLRSCDQLLVLSDDRVCIVFDELLDDNHVLLAALKVERAFEEPFSHDGQSIKLEVRAGHVYFGKQQALEGLQAEDLYRFAEAAREHAVQRKVAFEISTEEVFERMRRNWEINEAVASGLEAHELTLDYQPKYRLSDGDLVGAEAIVRWRRGGLIVPPCEFLPALSSETRWELTLYSIRRVIREMCELSLTIPIAVNVDASVVEDPAFLNALRTELSIWDVEPSRLAIEVAESATVAADPQLHGVLNTIRSMGTPVIIDHFGTGPAALEKFRDLPADEIKIDRSFVTNVAENPDDQRITETIIELAHRFSKTVVADGVEDSETFSYLAAAGCDVGQGFYLSAPLNESQFSQLLAAVA
jgi:EAL domain-containing protein (putative c-di-GMP-specific phosphodiesterase class I)/GGDEF domain-containing protein